VQLYRNPIYESDKVQFHRIARGRIIRSQTRRRVATPGWIAPQVGGP
jgi:hypothetical protein